MSTEAMRLIHRYVLLSILDRTVRRISAPVTASRTLGRYSEAQLESCHADANRAYEQVHLDMINHPPVRIRRTHVTLITKHLIPQRKKRKGGRIAAENS